MYNGAIISERIKKQAKAKGTTLKTLFEATDLGRNFIASSLTAGSVPKADNLAKIADYLDCSVDYLLGRTDNPEVNK